MSNHLIIECIGVRKQYDEAQLKVDVLHQINFSVMPGQSISIIGASGSGKSTFLHLLGGLDTPTAGRVAIAGQYLDQLNQKEIGQLRNQYLGFVYQFHHLLPEFSALENVMMPLLIAKKSKSEAESLAHDMLAKVGLKNRMMHRPSELSGGERQRSAIARALVNHPACILADEPTGNLDRKNAQNVIDMMLDLKTELNTSLVVVTHDDELAVHFDTVMKMEDGGLHNFK